MSNIPQNQPTQKDQYPNKDKSAQSDDKTKKDEACSTSGDKPERDSMKSSRI